MLSHALRPVHVVAFQRLTCYCQVTAVLLECLLAGADRQCIGRSRRCNTALICAKWLQGLLVVYKAQHGVRQGIINVNLSTASLQLEEAGLKGVQYHPVRELSGAFAVLAKPQRSLLPFKRNAVHPGKWSQPMHQPLTQGYESSSAWKCCIHKNRLHTDVQLHRNCLSKLPPVSFQPQSVQYNSCCRHNCTFCW